MTSSPPYCGLGSLSHQFPDAVVVTEFVVVADGVVTVAVAEVVDEVMFVVVVDVEVVVWVDVVELHDTNMNDATIRQVSIIQITPFFIQSSLFI
jgi:hypothetical protein